MIAPHDESYRNIEGYTLIVFNLRVPGTFHRLRSERAAWGESARMEFLGEGCVALVVKPGGARRLAR